MVCKTITFTKSGGEVSEGKPGEQPPQGTGSTRPTFNKRNLAIAGAAVAGLAYAATR